jgi:hypothetical protein
MATTSPESATQSTTDPGISTKDPGMRILVRFTAAPGVTADQYDETIRRLEKSGDWLPEGLEYHVAFKSNGNFRVTEIWDSQKQLDAFGERLMPVLKDVGIELSGKPDVLEIHNVIKRPS